MSHSGKGNRKAGARSGFVGAAFESGGCADDISKGPLRDFETGTGFAGAKLSEILPAARVARFVRVTDERSCCSLRLDDK
jgi:hypothetical protein